MRRTRFGILVLLIAASAGAWLVQRPATAATPSADTLSFTSPHVTWSQTGMNGATPAVRRITCNAPTACDDTTLTIDGGNAADAFADIKITPSAGNDMVLVIYPPGCPVDVMSTCYVASGHEARFTAPPKGSYVFRASCAQCTNASYTADATMTHFTPAAVEAGDQSFAWQTQPLDSSDSFFGEPSIDFNGKGNGIVNSFGPTVWITKDNGVTWGKAITNVDATGCPSGDADALVSFDDAFYADNLCTAGPTNLSYTSKDFGATWSGAAQGLPTEAGSESDRQWYAIDPKNPGVLYMSYHDFQNANIWVLKSTDYGQSFTQQVPVTITASNFVDTAFGNTSARPVVDPIDPNIVSLIYGSNTAQKSATALPTNTDFDLTQFYMAQSHDGGMSWTNTKLLDANEAFPYDGTNDNTVAHQFINAAIDTAGNIYLLFSLRLGSGTETHMMYTTVPRGSVKASTPVQVDSGGLGANVFGWIAAGDPGRADISWYGSLSPDNNDVSSNWFEMFAQTLDGLSDSPHFVQSRVSPKPMHTADICLAGTLCAATGGNRNLADFQAVAIDACGYAQAVWTDDAGTAAVMPVARQTAGSSVYSLNPCAPPVGPPVTPPPVTNQVADTSRFGGALALSLLAPLLGLFLLRQAR